MNFIRPLLCFLAAATTILAASKKEAPDPSKIKDKVTIAVGKGLTVQFQQQENVLSEPKVVEKPDAKIPTVTFAAKKEPQMVMLTTKNPFPKTLRFRALIRLQGHKDYAETSIIPVMAGLLSFESWQDPVEEIILFDFKLTDEKE